MIFGNRSDHSLMDRIIIGVGYVINLCMLLLLLAIALRGLLFLDPGLNESPFAHYLTLLLEPGTKMVHSAFDTFGSSPVFEDKDLSLAVLFVVILVVRNLFNWRLDKLKLMKLRRKTSEEKKKSSEKTGEDKAEASPEQGRKAAERRVALQTYSEAKSILETTKIELTFLSLDIVGSTNMKQGEDSYVIEQAFTDYRNLVEESLNEHEAYKATWTPDGQMAAFRTAQQAVNCGQNILVSLEDFNKNVSRMESPFRLRVGANTGVVSTDDETPMENISDFSIDVAGHLQKYANPNTIWASEETYEQLDNREGFKKIDERVDDRDVYGWKPG